MVVNLGRSYPDEAVTWTDAIGGPPLIIFPLATSGRYTQTLALATIPVAISTVVCWI